MKVQIKCIHRVSPRDTDASTVDAPSGALDTPERAWSVACDAGWVSGKMPKGRRNWNEPRRVTGGWCFFPPDRVGNWHSVTVSRID